MTALFGQDAVLDVLAKIGRPARLAEIVNAAPADLFQRPTSRRRHWAFSDALNKARNAGRVQNINGFWMPLVQSIDS